MQDEQLRISPSQINTFLDEPAIWVMNKFHKTYSEGGAKMWIGTSVEKALESILVYNFSYEDALEWAFKVFDIASTKVIDEDAAEQRARIPAILKQALELIIPLDGFQEFQTEIFGQIEGINVKAKSDFRFTGFHLDTKTTSRMISEVENMSAEHVRQLAIYRMLTGEEQRILYATEKKGAIYIPTQAMYTIAEQEIRGAVRAMKEAYNLGQDKCEILYCPRDFSSFRWDEITLKKAKEIWL